MLFHPNRNPPALAEFQRVPYQVRQTLRDPPSVPEGERNILLCRRDESQPFFQGQRLKRGPDGLHHFLHRVFAQNQLHTARLDLGKIEDIVDQPKQMLAVGLDIRQRLLQMGRNIAVDLIEHHLHKAEDRVHRCA